MLSSYRSHALAASLSALHQQSVLHRRTNILLPRRDSSCKTCNRCDTKHMLLSILVLPLSMVIRPAIEPALIHTNIFLFPVEKLQDFLCREHLLEHLCKP